MKAVLKGRVIAESDDLVEEGGYLYFPSADVRLELLERAGRRIGSHFTHGVQFYDVVIDGARHELAPGATRRRAFR